MNQVYCAVQASGEAVYTSDHALGGDELYSYPVESTQALATLESVDASQALKVKLSHDSTPCVVTQMLLPRSYHCRTSFMLDYFMYLSSFALGKCGLCARSTKHALPLVTGSMKL